MALPYDLYLRFLISKGMDDLKEVNSSLQELSIGTVWQSCYDKQFAVIDRSVPKGIITQIFSKKYNADFFKWMKILEIDDLWRAEKHFIEPEWKRISTVVYGINDDPHLRLCLNALLMKGLRGRDITESINFKFSCMLKEEHVELYRRFFFDPQRMTRSDWKGFLKGCDSKEKHIYFTALSEPLDILKTELEMPANVNVTEPLQFLLTKSFVKAKQYLEFSTKEANNEARAWISQVLNITEKYMKYKSSDTTDFAKTLQMEFDFVDSEFPTPDAETLKQLQEELMAKEEIAKN